MPDSSETGETGGKSATSTIAFNASFFNTHRMVQQYAANAYV